MAGPRPKTLIPSDATSQNVAQASSPNPRHRRQPERLSRDARKIQRGEGELYGLPSLAEDQDGGGERAGHGHEKERASRRRTGEKESDPKPEEQVGPKEDLEERDGGGHERSQDEVPGASIVFVAREGDESPQREGEGRNHGIRVHERQQEVAAEEIGPPVGLNVRGEDEGEVGQDQRPWGESHRGRRSAEAGQQGPDDEHEGESPESDVEPGQGVPGVRAGP